MENLKTLVPHFLSGAIEDNLNRLTTATVKGTDFGYGYDSVGNILNVTKDSVTQGSYTYTGNRIDGLTYNADGNLTDDGYNTYDYDALGQTVSITNTGGTVSYEYDALGKRILKSDADTGRHYFNARYLNAVTDTVSPELPPRFLNPDVVLGNPGNGQSWNRYASCVNNPVKYVDPDGLEVAFALKGTPGYMNQANRDKLRTELSQITGWSVNDIEIKNNVLTVKPSAQATGGSKEARKRLKEFIDDPYKVVVYDASGDNTVLFGQGSQRRDSSAGGQIQLDFSDFGNITYHNVEKLSYDVGMTFFHEGGHAFLDYVDPNSNKRGRTCHRWVDKIRGQLKLTKRRNYEAHPTGSGTNRLEFKGRDKYIEW